MKQIVKHINGRDHHGKGETPSENPKQSGAGSTVRLAAKKALWSFSSLRSSSVEIRSPANPSRCLRKVKTECSPRSLIRQVPHGSTTCFPSRRRCPMSFYVHRIPHGSFLKVPDLRLLLARWWQLCGRPRRE